MAVRRWEKQVRCSIHLGQSTSSYSTIPACFISQILGTHFTLWIRMNTAIYVSELNNHSYHRQSPDQLTTDNTQTKIRQIIPRSERVWERASKRERFIESKFWETYHRESPYLITTDNPQTYLPQTIPRLIYHRQCLDYLTSGYPQTDITLTTPRLTYQRQSPD